MDWSFMAAPAVSLLGGFMSQNSAENAAKQQYERQKDLMQMQHDYNITDYTHRYQWTTWDLKQARLNPILAATNGLGGSINGVSSGAASMAQTPDFGNMLGSSMSSAFQLRNQKEIAKLQNDLGKSELELRKIDVNSAIDQRRNDITIANGRFELEKMVQEAAVKRADALNDATIQNMKDRLKADIEHYERMDMNGASMAAAALASANAHGLMAAISEKLSISREEVMQAQQAYIGLQSTNAEESLKWQKWLNDHPYVRGAVGFIGSLLDTAGLVGSFAKPGSAAFRNILSGSDDISSGSSGYYDESWFR